MSLADELKKLEELRWNGTLTDEEFARAKAALLDGLEKSSEPAAGENAEADVSENLAAQLAEVRYQNELARIDREWEQEKEQYMVTDKHGNRHSPSQFEGTIGGIIAAVFGTIWTMGSCVMLQPDPMWPDRLPLFIEIGFPLFGVVFVCLGIYVAVRSYTNAEAYNQAFAAYKQRRAAVKPENFR